MAVAGFVPASIDYADAITPDAVPQGLAVTTSTHREGRLSLAWLSEVSKPSAQRLVGHFMPVAFAAEVPVATTLAAPFTTFVTTNLPTLGSLVFDQSLSVVDQRPVEVVLNDVSSVATSMALVASTQNLSITLALDGATHGQLNAVRAELRQIAKSKLGLSAIPGRFQIVSTRIKSDLARTVSRMTGSKQKGRAAVLSIEEAALARVNTFVSRILVENIDRQSDLVAIVIAEIGELAKRQLDLLDEQTLLAQSRAAQIALEIALLQSFLQSA